MTFLVTGGLGLIGHNIVARLQAREESVVIVDTKTTYGIIPQTEIDYLNGYVCRLGAKHGVPTPVNQTLLTLVKLVSKN